MRMSRRPYPALMTALRRASIDLLAKLVAVDSCNPSLVPGAAGEGDIVRLLAERLAVAGFATTIVCPPEQAQRPSLVALAPGPVDAPIVVLCGHLDTVGVAGMDDPFTPRIEGRRLYGRGAADMKGGIAALVVAAEHLVATGAPVRAVLALVADEEDANLGSEAVIAALPAMGVNPTVCLIAEPTDLALARTLRGFGVVEVDFAGRAAHSSQASEGINAVTHLGRLLAAVDERAQDLRALGGDLMVTLVQGGSSAFVIPDRATCLVELRTAPEGRGADVHTEVHRLLQDHWQATVRLVAARDGWLLTTHGPAADLAAALGAAMGTGTTFDAPYWMEAPLWEALCPTVICGPSGGGLHASDEWVDLDQVGDFATAVAGVLGTWTPPSL